MLLLHHFIIIILVGAKVTRRAEVHGHRIVTFVRFFSVENMAVLSVI
jgi:hypothetical protein